MKFVTNIEHTEQQVIGTVDIVVPKDIAPTDEEALANKEEIRKYEKLLKQWTKCISRAFDKNQLYENNKREASSIAEIDCWTKKHAGLSSIQQ
jgi:hypothetical protein